ncbi:FUSC family protein [Ancylobacter sp. VKM B-3255]|uniref:FUSC family protein n=1 Tax=Ancylobacter radicis TaxID=2836179 RepID=A0ABS5R8R0_9HYPH|nr:FUSC family protein [Ancylobacter radicis]
MFGVRLAASVCLALYITYFLELQNSFWAATTAAIVCQPNLGASLQKGRYRAIGTIVGALVMVALLAMFPQQRNTLLLSLALWCGLCGFAVVMLRNFASYAAALAGITAAIIFADTLTDPSTAFFLAVIRVGEICIGIAAASFVMMLTDFGSASRQLARTVRQVADQVASGFLGTLAQTGETPELQAARRNVVRSLGLLETQIDAAIGESSFLRARTSNLRLMNEALVNALVAWRNVGNHHGRHGDGQALIRETLVPLLRRIDLAQLDRAPFEVQRICREVVSRLRNTPSIDTTSCIATDAARDVALGLAALVDGIILLREHEGARLTRPFPPLVVADPLPAVLNGLRVFVAVLATAAFWVVSAWPSGPFAIVFAAIGTLVFGSFGDQARALAKDYAIGAALMAALGAGLYFGVLPSLSSFPALIAVLALLFIPLGVMQAGPWHSVVFLAMSIASLPLLGVGNPISYNASDYFNLAFAIVTGTVIGTLFFVVMPTIPPQVRARRLVALSLRDFRCVADGTWRTDHAHWTTLLTRRTEALPPQTTPEQAGELMALLALGQAVIHLRQVVTLEPAAGLLSQALHALADARLMVARDAFGALVRASDEGPVSTAEADRSRPVHLRAAVAVITDAIDLHGALLAARIDPRVLFLSSFS